ncbi:KGG domain-containing protein [Massilia polaris]|uniref:KGG domain-containing protein n=1 Tax=Massilia polaris TaxID=2728846 RepID=UPI001E2F30D8|nr:KGG domain-containing protein [Massilia polaris]
MATSKEGGKRSGTQQKAGSGSGQGPAKRGFAAMDENQQREIASKGGQAAHQKGTAHEFDSEEARRAGQKGGEVVSRNREHMADIGRKGGESRQSASRAAPAGGGQAERRPAERRPAESNGNRQGGKEKE